MIRESVLPAMTAELAFYGSSVSEAGKYAPKYMTDRAEELSSLITKIYENSEKLDVLYAKKACKPMNSETGKEIYTEVCPLMEEIRSYINRYEMIASDRFYSLPSYENMLFRL